MFLTINNNASFLDADTELEYECIEVEFDANDEIKVTKKHTESTDTICAIIKRHYNSVKSAMKHCEESKDPVRNIGGFWDCKVSQNQYW